MPKLKDMRPVEADFVRTAPNRNELRQQLPRASAVMFEALKDPACWKAFLNIDVTWTSPEPFGVGTTRTVKGSGQTIEEHFLSWEEGTKMGFRFERATLPVSAFAEEWELVSTGDNSCELIWRYAYEWGGPLPDVLGRVFGTLFGLNAKRSLTKLAKYAATI